MDKKNALCKIEKEIRVYIGINVRIEEDAEDLCDYVIIHNDKEIGSIIYYEDEKFISTLTLKKKSIEFSLPCLHLELKHKADIDISKSFDDMSLNEIKTKYSYEEYYRTIKKTPYIKFKLISDNEGNSTRFEKDESRLYNHSIDNEGGNDIKFYVHNGKMIEKQTNREIKALIDIGGQFCERLIPVLLCQS